MTTEKQATSELSPHTHQPIILQGFEWKLPNHGNHWNILASNAKRLADLGFTAIWIPPFVKPVKLNDGLDEVGYGVYDHWDLGEFDQCGMVRTKYGTKEELIEMIKVLHANGIEVYGDIIMNHKVGKPGNEEVVDAIEVNKAWRYHHLSESQHITAYTHFDFSEARNQYSDFVWTSEHFTGVDSAAMGETFADGSPKRIFLLKNKQWDEETDKHELGNFDFLIASDIDLRHPEVIDEFNTWGEWVTKELNLDGYRLDAIKHMNRSFTCDWLDAMREKSGKPLLTLGEFWSGDLGANLDYLEKIDYRMSLFDARLHWNMYAVTQNHGNFDLRYLLHETLMKHRPHHAITIVDNHDTQPRHNHSSFIEKWFKPHAYALILTREEGTPCVFYGDLAGLPNVGYAGIPNELAKLMYVRQHCSFGKQHECLYNERCIGWSREGSWLNESGCAVLINTGPAQTQNLYVGGHHAGEVWIDAMGGQTHEVVVPMSGWLTCSVGERACAVWINKSHLKDLPVSNPIPPQANQMRIRYQKPPHFSELLSITYRQSDSDVWHSLPMKRLLDGSYEIHVSLHEAIGIECCFHDELGQWDNRHGQNYHAYSGKIQIENGSITRQD